MAVNLNIYTTDPVVKNLFNKSQGALLPLKMIAGRNRCQTQLLLHQSSLKYAET